MVHGHVHAEVPNAHRYLVKSIDEGSQRLPLLLEDTNQGNGGQMVRTACDEMCLELGHQRREAIDGVGRELREPGESSSL